MLFSLITVHTDGVEGFKVAGIVGLVYFPTAGCPYFITLD